MKDPKKWESKDLRSQQIIWHFCFEIKEIGIFAEASDFNKKKAQQLASQKFLKQFFPVGFTWNKVIEVIFDKKSKEMNEILEQKNKMLLGEI